MIMNMNSHFKISLIKSILRILGCIIAIIVCFWSKTSSIIILSSALLVAEILGILEEIKDTRK